MNNESKQARKSGIRALQAAGLFQPARQRVRNGVGKRAHLIDILARKAKHHREYDPAQDWVEVGV